MDYSIDIAVSLFGKKIESLESKLLSPSLRIELKYNPAELNASLAKSFSEVTQVLQRTVDSFYLGCYEVQGFQPLDIKDFDFCITHNLSLVANAKKLLKFIN